LHSGASRAIIAASPSEQGAAQMRIDVPGRAPLEIRSLLLDFNGTLAQDGAVSAAAKSLLARLSGHLRICVATADTRGNAAAACAGLPVELRVLAGGAAGDEAKLALLEELGADHTVAVGNGRNDALILGRALVSICVVGSEGAHKRAVTAAQVLVPSVEDALAMLARPERLIATLRN
jgi:soluble P-type ATPase